MEPKNRTESISSTESILLKNEVVTIEKSTPIYDNWTRKPQSKNNIAQPKEQRNISIDSQEITPRLNVISRSSEKKRSRDLILERNSTKRRDTPTISSIKT